MNILEYKESVIEEVKFNAVSDRISDKESFLNYVTEVLIGADEIEDFELLTYEGVGKGGKKILQIDGYYYNDLDESLSIFIAPPLSYFSESTLTATDAEKYFSRAKGFIEQAKFIQDNAEESAPGYGFAIDIKDRYKDVRKYVIYLITDMVMSKNIKELDTDSINYIPVEYQIWDVNRLFLLAESETGKEDIIINLKDFGIKGIPCLSGSKTEDYTAYLCNIPGIILATLYNVYGGKLLEGNVRSFLQTKGKVNKGIRSTILNEPTMFFAYNNGIATTAKNIVTEDIDGVKYITEITDLQIVNGGQTTASLASALLNDKKDGSEANIKEIFVPMKLSVVSLEKEQKLVESISRYANSQNKVSDADLWSNHPFHRRMEDFSRRILAPAVGGKQYGTHWYYERANGQYKQETYKSTDAQKTKFFMSNPKDHMFNKTDLARLINLELMRPDIASAGGQKSFTKFAEWANKKWVKDDTIFSEEFFRRVIALNIIFAYTEKTVSVQPWFGRSYKRNIVSYTIAKIFYEVKEKYANKKIDFRNIWFKQALSSAWVREIEIVSEKMYNHLTDVSRLIENVTEWAKRDACWEQAKEVKIELIPEFVKELLDRSVAVEQQKDAKKEQKLTNNINVMVEVANYGIDGWKYLLEWSKNHKGLTPPDIQLVNTAITMEKGAFPTENQCAKILHVLKRAQSEGFPK